MSAARNVLVGALFTLCLPGCNELFPSEGGEDSSGKVPLPGQYSFSAYSEEGTLLVSGRIAIALEDTSRITGTWTLRAEVPDPQVGPMVGDGTLEGYVDGEMIHMNMNPGWADNNVFLLGKKAGSRLTGTWEHVGFAGVIATGSFAALREGKTTEPNSSLKSFQRGA